MEQYVKNPDIVDAMQFDGNFKNLDQSFNLRSLVGFKSKKEEDDHYLLIPTLFGEKRCNVGDYVVHGINGEFYVYTPEVFNIVYKPL